MLRFLEPGSANDMKIKPKSVKNIAINTTGVYFSRRVIHAHKASNEMSNTAKNVVIGSASTARLIVTMFMTQAMACRIIQGHAFFGTILNFNPLYAEIAQQVRKIEKVLKRVKSIALTFLNCMRYFPSLWSNENNRSSPVKSFLV